MDDQIYGSREIFRPFFPQSFLSVLAGKITKKHGFFPGSVKYYAKHRANVFTQITEPLAFVA